MCTTYYEVQRRKNEDGEKIIFAKNHHNAITFNCWFETSSDKLPNVTQSFNVSSLETICL